MQYQQCELVTAVRQLLTRVLSESGLSQNDPTLCDYKTVSCKLMLQLTLDADELREVEGGAVQKLKK